MARGHAALEEQTRFPITNVYDATTGTGDSAGTRVVVVLDDDATHDTVERSLRGIWGVTRGLRVQLPAPMPSMIRNWTRMFDGNDPYGLTRRRAAV